MKNIGILLLTTVIAACAGNNGATPAEMAGGDKLTEPPAALMERKPLVIPDKNTRIYEENSPTEAHSQVAQTKTTTKIVSDNTSPKTGVKEPAKKRVPYQNVAPVKTSLPQLYYVLASRTVNKMLKSTAIIYKSVKSPTMYVENPQNENPAVELPNLESAANATKDIISGSHTYALTENRSGADYILQTYVAQTKNYEREKPILSYRLILKNRANEKIGTWVDSLSPISNDDQSWW